MERTESVVVSVAPQYENEKIQEMGGFGWNLQGRQEIMGHLREAEAPDSLAASVFQGAMDGATSTVRVTYDHYVKLHFVRDLNMPNIARIQELEREYRSLHIPPSPSFKTAGCFTLFGAFGVVAYIFILNGPNGQPGGVATFLVWTGLGVLWLWWKLRKRADANTAAVKASERARQLVTEVASLLSRA
jgi:hypothetical protein